MNENEKIAVFGSTGLVGSAITRCLFYNGFNNLITPSHEELDLTDINAVNSYFTRKKPQYVILAAAKVGGIWANNVYRADFILNNLQIQTNVISVAYQHGVEKLLFLGSSCIYPKSCPQPIKEEFLLTGPLEYTNEPYAIAKIAGLKLCESYNIQYGTNFVSIMPTNLYGPYDNFDLKFSHVIPALIRKLHLGKLSMQGRKADIEKDETLFGPIPEDFRVYLNKNANQITLWGTGKPRREFLYVDDLADAVLFVMENIDFGNLKGETAEIRNNHLNIGTGFDISIAEVAEILKMLVGYEGEIIFDPSYPDGTPRKILDVIRINNLGWQSKTDLKTGLVSTYEWYLKLSNIA